MQAGLTKPDAETPASGYRSEGTGHHAVRPAAIRATTLPTMTASAKKSKVSERRTVPERIAAGVQIVDHPLPSFFKTADNPENRTLANKSETGVSGSRI